MGVALKMNAVNYKKELGLSRLNDCRSPAYGIRKKKKVIFTERVIALRLNILKSLKKQKKHT